MAANMCMQRNCTESNGFFYDMMVEDTWAPWGAAMMEYFEHSPWFFSLLGSTMIGLTGIFPLLIIPIDEGVDLKNGGTLIVVCSVLILGYVSCVFSTRYGTLQTKTLHLSMSVNVMLTLEILNFLVLGKIDGAGTLKVLLSFAVGGLLGDVFLHLLPEAWENSSLKTGSDAGHSSMNCGLWVLGGFLVFVIAEKLFGFEQEAEKEDVPSTELEVCEKSNTEAEKEMENNNCINLIGSNPKNGFSKKLSNDFPKAIDELQPFLEKKNGYSQLSNGYKDARSKNNFITNGIKPVLMCDELSKPLEALPLNEVKDCLIKKLAKTNGCTKQSNLTDVCDEKNIVKEKSKHITGYLNLMANIIDNFTHGLAVGGSFLVSFRLGALTTFAILIHEIPHEVGDFAILLRSGFNRWDAARAQLMTASGGIFGAMSAVIFSGGEVGARTYWILPFTAGGFLHIGMVTILPELLKESNPKESLKQLSALLFGILVMAVLTILCD